MPGFLPLPGAGLSAPPTPLLFSAGSWCWAPPSQPPGSRGLWDLGAGGPFGFFLLLLLQLLLTSPPPPPPHREESDCNYKGCCFHPVSWEYKNPSSCFSPNSPSLPPVPLSCSWLELSAGGNLFQVLCIESVITRLAAFTFPTPQLL